jgi:hypothetical protein
MQPRILQLECEPTAAVNVRDHVEILNCPIVDVEQHEEHDKSTLKRNWVHCQRIVSFQGRTSAKTQSRYTVSYVAAGERATFLHAFFRGFIRLRVSPACVPLPAWSPMRNVNLKIWINAGKIPGPKIQVAGPYLKGEGELSAARPRA